VTAFSSYVDQLHDSGDPELIAQCTEKIRDAVLNEWHLIVQLVPAFEKMLDVAQSSDGEEKCCPVGL
jgi:hypothetical protein